MTFHDFQMRLLSNIDKSKLLDQIRPILTPLEFMMLSMRIGADGCRPKSVAELAQEVGRTKNSIYHLQRTALKKVERILLANLASWKPHTTEDQTGQIDNIIKGEK
jgi:DNA-directed RNA polymerase sigma subunit (sigma70/sigma32)